MKSDFVILVFSFLMVLAPALGQTARRSRPVPPHLVMEKLSTMTPEQRQTLLDRIPPGRRELVEERLRKYNEMPEPAKKRLRDEYRQFQQLSPEKQNDMRKLFRQLGSFPDDRRKALRKEIVRLRNMPAERRSARIKSSEFAGEFSDKERDFLSSLTNLLTVSAVAR